MLVSNGPAKRSPGPGSLGRLVAAQEQRRAALCAQEIELLVWRLHYQVELALLVLLAGVPLDALFQLRVLAKQPHGLDPQVVQLVVLLVDDDLLLVQLPLQVQPGQKKFRNVVLSAGPTLVSLEQIVLVHLDAGTDAAEHHEAVIDAFAQVQWPHVLAQQSPTASILSLLN